MIDITVTPSPNPHLTASNSVKHKDIWTLQLIVCNMKYPSSQLCAFLGISAHLSSHVPVFIHDKYLFKAVYSLMGNRIRRIFNTDARERPIFACFMCSWTYVKDFVTWYYHEGGSTAKKNRILQFLKIIKNLCFVEIQKFFHRSPLGDAKNHMRN